MSVRTRIPLPARSGWSARLAAGDTVGVVDVAGGQAADLWVFDAADPAEHLSAQHTRVHMGEAYPRVGWTFVTNRRRPILEFVTDTSPGRHDCLAAACDQARYVQLANDPEHGSCEENLLRESREHGLGVTFAPQPVNVFANFRVQPDGRFELLECVSRPGDTATFRLLTDAVVVLSACPQDILGFQPGGPSDMAVELGTAGAEQ